MTGERRNSGISGDGRRRAPSRASSTAAQSARRRGNKRIKGLPSRIPQRTWGVLRRSGAALIGPVGGRALRGVLMLAAVGVAVAGVAFGWRAIVTSPTFALDDIEVTGAVRATADEIRALSAVEPGDNAVALDTDEIARLVEKHAWVGRATVLRRLPRGLTIAVEEHTPAALVALEHLYFVDADGEVVKRLVPGEHEALPVITGLARADVETGDALAMSQIRAALRFIEVWAHAHPDAALDEVHVGPAGEITVNLIDRGLRVHLGPAPWDDALARYRGVAEELASRTLQATEIDASSERHPDRAVVRLAAAEQPQSTKTSKPRTRGAQD